MEQDFVFQNPVLEQVFLFLAGPAAFLAIGIFFVGLTIRLALYFLGLDWHLDRVAYKTGFKIGLKGGLHSIAMWLIPFATNGWRKNPAFTCYFFAFHFSLLVLPFFLAGHNEILEKHLGFSFPVLPDAVADILTIIGICGVLGLLLRRLILPEVYFLTRTQDYGFLLLGSAPIFTGLGVSLYGSGPDWWLCAHLATVEILLILAPFTRFSHIVLYFASRWQIGADYSIKRGGSKRGAFFPW